MAYLNINIPPIECYIRTNFLQNRKEFSPSDTYFPVTIFGMSSIPGTSPLFHFILEDGGLWWRMPIHAFCSRPDVPLQDLHQLVLWNSFSNYVSCTQFLYLSGMRMSYINRSKEKIMGTYLFTLDWAHEDKNIPNVGFSEAPGQHKCGHVIERDDGNYAIQPNNRVKVYEPSFVTKPDQFLIERKLNTHSWSVENVSKWVLSDNDKYDYDIEENDV